MKFFNFLSSPSGISPPSADVAGLPRRVLLVSRSLPCHVPGGLEYHVLDLAHGLKRLGLDVGLLSTPTSSEYREEIEASGLYLHEVPEVAPGKYTPAYFRGVGAAINQAIEDRHYTLVHGQEFGFGLWDGPTVADVHVVMTVHGTITSETALHPDLFNTLSAMGRLRALRRYGRRLFFSPIWNRMMVRSERILVDSEFTRRELERIRPEVLPRVRLVPLGVDMSRYPSMDVQEARLALDWRGEGTPQLLTIGRLEWQKGHDLALEALARLRDLPWRYWIVGEGGIRVDLENQIRQLGLEDRVQLTGRVDAETKSRMLAAADLFVWPERTHPAFGLVGLEAMLMNTPVLGARRGAIPELIDERSGWTHEAESVDALMNALEPLLRDGSLLSDRAAGLREHTLTRYAPEAMARGTIEVYREFAAEEPKGT